MAKTLILNSQNASDMNSDNRLSPMDIQNAVPVMSHTIKQDFLLFNPPDPEPGWVTRCPDRALVFFFVSPRPCAALDELMGLSS